MHQTDTQAIADGSRATKGRVLVVDDEPSVLKILERILGGVGTVVTCSNGNDAIERIRASGIEAVVSDISMPGLNGLELLRAIRAHDADVPVVLVTGHPTIESATQAIEHGVFRYVTKPFESESLKRTVTQAVQLYRLACIKREALGLAGVVGASDRIGLDLNFRHALDSLWVDFQPIVSVSGRSTFAYEALMRNAEPSLPTPSHVLDAAERLDALFDVGRLVRTWAGRLFQSTAADHLLFLNLHPADLMDPELGAPDSPLASLADRVVLEITERSSLDKIDDVRARIAVLRARGFRIAIDDLGAGYAGLTSFALLEPDIVKLDVSLVRDVDQNPIKQKLIASMTSLCREMGMTAIAEGVESTAERDALTDLGCDLLQGYLFARPGPPFPEPRWL
jgi:EAL domain-containing protein (putative c-di-GMP-specific phosphodiesterase class I)